VSGWPLQPPTALEYFAALVADDVGPALLEAAVLVAQDDFPGLDAQAVLCDIDTLGERLARRIPADAAPMQRLRQLNRFFFDELGFQGNVNDYYDPRNSYVHEVLATRRGIPITLALLYAELAGHARLPARGVGFPGHFLVKLSLPRGEVVIDPFSGQSLSREELEARLQPYRRRQALPGGVELPLALFLQAAAPRDTLARLLHNLKEIHRTAQDWPRLLGVMDRLVILLPDRWEERRDRGLALLELGRHDGAAEDLSAYLAHRGDAPDAPAVGRHLARLRRPDGRQLH
jgi:regulator of sirC expression with transglutaminase-like and TPR domain